MIYACRAAQMRNIWLRNTTGKLRHCLLAALSALQHIKLIFNYQDYKVGLGNLSLFGIRFITGQPGWFNDRHSEHDYVVKGLIWNKETSLSETMIDSLIGCTGTDSLFANVIWIRTNFIGLMLINIWILILRSSYYLAYFCDCYNLTRKHL